LSLVRTELSAIRQVGKPADHVEGRAEGIVVAPKGHYFVNYQGEKIGGQVVVTDRGLEIRGFRSAGFGKHRATQVPLVTWDQGSGDRDQRARA
jgi:hypothetical protein